MVVRTSTDRIIARLARRCSAAANTGDDPTRAVVGAGADAAAFETERLANEDDAGVADDDPIVADPITGDEVVDEPVVDDRDVDDWELDDWELDDRDVDRASLQCPDASTVDEMGDDPTPAVTPRLTPEPALRSRTSA